ncbi:MAG: cell division protein ZapA, partial [Candidatus Theseobacter exili]|nr:cell division protein ZapA [Candidatus Theseobacter exili]
MTTSTERKIEIFGRKYTLKSDLDVEYIDKLAEYLNSKMMELSREFPMVSMARLAVMTSLNIADELFRLKTEKKGFVERIERSVAQVV